MALHIVKLPFISRCCDSSNSTLFFLSKSYSPLHGRLLKSHLHRSFAVSKSEKLQIPKKKKRLDELCLERFQQYSRTFIQSWILQGKVCVNGKVVNKAGTTVSDKAVVEIIAEIPKYVCRAGYKLEAAIEQLSVDVAGKIALDSGLSTGGFTDCLLQYGASYVYGVDVGYGQVADKIRRDERVCVIERTNLRYLSGLPKKVDLVTLDLSFISILLVSFQTFPNCFHNILALPSFFFFTLVSSPIPLCFFSPRNFLDLSKSLFDLAMICCDVCIYCVFTVRK
ncbi:hypothetical protein V6Z11_A11G158600 [Gossypium hirsutum]